MTKENQAAIEFVKAKLVCAISQLEKDVGITMAYPISLKILEAVQACDDALFPPVLIFKLATDSDLRNLMRTGRIIRVEDPGDLHGCDPIREGSKEKPEWEDNPK